MVDAAHSLSQKAAGIAAWNRNAFRILRKVRLKGSTGFSEEDSAGKVPLPIRRRRRRVAKGEFWPMNSGALSLWSCRGDSMTGVCVEPCCWRSARKRSSECTTSDLRLMT